MSSGSNGARRVASLLRPSIIDSGVCRSCQETLGRRSYSSAAPAIESTSASTAADPAVKPAYIINAGVVLSRPPQITRELEPFEKAFFFYQKRLNEPDEDWKKKIQERRTAARDIGKYNAYDSDAWNDELLLGAKESEPEHQIEALVQDAESTANATSQDTSKKEEIPRPYPRITEADKKNDQKSLDRLLSRTLYLLVQSKEGHWKFPSSPVESGETLRLAAERTLAQSAGVNMNTWFVGFHPVGWHSFNPRRSKADNATEIEAPGSKIFFLKSRMMAGQADLSVNTQGLKDFKWLAKEELAQYLNTQYYSNIKNMLADR
ncbi:hypothetical protein N7489_000405 [Penicillium chrysogenum]|uniref:uncharacterized protein n=1 Tax=Penicillium chrysogenum TaxID=5076 RepID=UPI0024DF265E|nr:uncharacterized protein N7489_000405 [Penicillium chrysogenum]KAJ5249995.1 hypothetical protein N7489_000405 [Penicillium chrysogenum]